MTRWVPVLAGSAINGCGNLHVLVGRFGNAGGDAVCILERGNVTRSALVS